MEHAEVQDAAARRDAEATGAFVEVGTRPDLTGRPRMLVARRTATAAHGASPGTSGESSPDAVGGSQA